MEGFTLGVFGTDKAAKENYENSVAKKSEAEGIAVFHRTEGGKRFTLMDTADFPERIQGYARIASIVDHAMFFYPSGQSTSGDGELAVLLDSMALAGTTVVCADQGPQSFTSAFNGTVIAGYPAESRLVGSSAVDFSRVRRRDGLPDSGALVYVDRAFTVKGVGTVVLGFVLSGSIAVHDKLRPIPGPEGLRPEVKGIQVNDQDFDSVGVGVRVGISLRGAEADTLTKSHWLDDGSLVTSRSVPLDFRKSPFYKLEVAGRDLHLQVQGELVPSRFSAKGKGLVAEVPYEIPVWDGMRGVVIDLNGKNLRVAGGASCKF